MSVTVYARNILEQMVTADHGDKLMLSFATAGERDSLRTMLYRQKRELAKKMPALASRIIIKQISNEEGIFLLVEKDETLKSFSGVAVMQKAATGEIEEVDLTKLNILQREAMHAADKAKRKNHSAEPSLTRTIRLMQEDGAIKNPKYTDMRPDLLADLIVDGVLTMEDLEKNDENSTSEI